MSVGPTIGERPAAAIVGWAIGAIGIAAIALAGDRTFFRVEPTTPARLVSIGLTLWLAIGWPIWSRDRLARAFVCGQGAILVVIASATIGEAAVCTAWWLTACGAAFATKWATVPFPASRPLCWTLAVCLTVGTIVYGLLRTALGQAG